MIIALYIFKVTINHTNRTRFNGIKKTKESKSDYLHPNMSWHDKDEHNPKGNNFIPNNATKIFPAQLFTDLAANPTS